MDLDKLKARYNERDSEGATDMAALIAEVERLREENERLRADFSEARFDLCEAAGGHNWQYQARPDPPFLGPYQVCLTCGSSRTKP
jgi:hypothetical protein